jgi:hypothetical protein
MIGWASIIGAVGQIADDLITTDEERAKLALESRRIDAALQQGQIDTNKIEAAHPSRFVAGWRPAAGWVAAISLALAFMPKALVITGIWTYQAIVLVASWNGTGAPPVLPAFPDLGTTDLIGLLASLLGLGGMRSWEKARNVDTKVVE